MGNNLITDGGNVDVYFTKYKSYVATITQPFTYLDANEPFEVGKLYQVEIYNEGDDFTNIGASSNENGIEFIATGTTAANWTNGSGVNKGFELVVDVANANDANYLGDIVWERVGKGYFIGTLENAFVNRSKVFTFVCTNIIKGQFILNADDDSTLELETAILDFTDAAAPDNYQDKDGLLLNTPVKVEVYQ